MADLSCWKNLILFLKIVIKLNVESTNAQYRKHQKNNTVTNIIFADPRS
jgi:hypothetical protein